MSRDLNMATMFMKQFAIELTKKAKEELNLNVIVTSVERTFQHQMALYAQGRQSLEEVTLLRNGVGLPPITEEENSRCVTWTMASKHIINLLDMDPLNDKSRAVDFGIIIGGKYLANDKDIDADGIPEYEELGLLGERIGGSKVKWGGRFKKPDKPHFEEV